MVGYIAIMSFICTNKHLQKNEQIQQYLRSRSLVYSNMATTFKKLPYNDIIRSCYSVPVIRAVSSDSEWEHRPGNNTTNHPSHPTDWRDLHVLYKVSAESAHSLFFPEFTLLHPVRLLQSFNVILFPGSQHMQVRMEATLLEVSVSHTLLQSHHRGVGF